MNVIPVATAASAGAAESRLAAGAADLGRLAEAGASRQAALSAGLAQARAWQAARDEEAKAPAARLTRLAQDTVIWFGDGVDFVDSALAHRQLAALAAAAKAGGGGLRVIGYADFRGLRGEEPCAVAIAR